MPGDVRPGLRWTWRGICPDADGPPHGGEGGTYEPPAPEGTARARQVGRQHEVPASAPTNDGRPAQRRPAIACSHSSFRAGSKAMTESRLRSFVALADSGSVRAAAQHLYVTESAVSAA